MNHLLLAVYVPTRHAESLKQALFAAGAGRIENYSNCCWQTDGIGQFKPEIGSTPHLGQQGKIHTEPELKIEFILAASLQETIIATLKQHHPYETPAYFLTEIIT